MGIAMGPRLFTQRLTVMPTGGAGLDVNPEEGGMRVISVAPTPGQGELQPGDFIVAVDGVDLGRDIYSVVSTYQGHFRDGALLSVQRSAADAQRYLELQTMPSPPQASLPSPQASLPTPAASQDAGEGEKLPEGWTKHWSNSKRMF